MSAIDDNQVKVHKNHTFIDIKLDVEAETLTAKHPEVDFPVLEECFNLQSRKLINCCLYLALIWFATEYLSNSALANTSVASTTVLTSTSGLFTLLFGSLIGKDSVSVAKIVAVLISMTGVTLTTIGKTWARDQKLSVSDIVLLKRIAESDGLKPDMQKALGYVGLFTALSLWWLTYNGHYRPTDE